MQKIVLIDTKYGTRRVLGPFRYVYMSQGDVFAENTLMVNLIHAKEGYAYRCPRSVDASQGVYDRVEIQEVPTQNEHPLDYPF